MIFLKDIKFAFHFFILGIGLLAPYFVEACSTCFGDPNSQMAQGVNMAVALMLVVVAVVLGLFAWLILFFRKRAKNIKVTRKDFESL